MNGMFEKYVKMIQKKAWEVSKKTGVEYEELEAQGFYYYCKALESWDRNKSSFSTHLYYELMQLESYYLNYIGFSRGHKTDELSEIQEKRIESNYGTVTLKDVLETAKEILTEKSYNIIKWVLERSWEQPNRRKPSISLCCKVFNIPRNECKTYWNEIKNFWNNNCFTLA